VEGHCSVGRASAEIRFSLIKLRVAPESTRAARVEEKPISDTDRWIRFDEKRDIEVLIQAVLKSLTSQGLGTGSFPDWGLFVESEMEAHRIQEYS
jgi:hypothetical protein